MKFNWGHGITIVIILFMSFILTLIYKMHYRDADLVQDDFYDQEVLFNAKKESIANYNSLDFQVEILQEPNGIEIIFPETYTPEYGTVEFYRADDKSLDRSYNLILDNNSKLIQKDAAQ